MTVTPTYFSTEYKVCRWWTGGHQWKSENVIVHMFQNKVYRPHYKKKTLKKRPASLISKIENFTGPDYTSNFQQSVDVTSSI